MDNGAHFYKCDFQVHTPRDLAWSGADAATEKERKAYAEELVLACRQKDLGAIAITDHHDFAFFPYVKRAAQNELDDDGAPIDAARRLIAFPGIELTLTAPACQALLILDADFPENLLASVLTALAITPAPTADAKHAAIKRIPQEVIGSLTELYDKLNTHDHIRGRFTVFPNVTERGHGTLLRSGFGNFYKSMPCVGGYIDGAISKFGQGNKTILSGQNREYGFKSIAVIQTSDNRKRDHADLGIHTTWIKWSEPTGEALRQACLAKESRLSHDDPALPSIWITSLTISNSKFLGRVSVDLSQQYNAIIGGRGTGKSTLLEYLRWALCDQPVDDGELDVAPGQARRRKLIDDTLQPFRGEVVVTALLNDVQHIVKRNSETRELALKIGDGSFAATTETELRNLFRIQAYSQKQLSNVGVRLDELRRFVELPIRQLLDQVTAGMRDVEIRLRAAYGNVIRKRELEAEAQKARLEVESLTEQVGTLRKSLKGLSETDQNTIKEKALYDNEVLIVENLRDELERAKELVDSMSESLEDLGGVDEDDEAIQNTAIIKAIRAKYAETFAKIREHTVALTRTFAAGSVRDLAAAVKAWDDVKAVFDKRYSEAAKRAKLNQQQLTRIQEIEKRVADLKKLLTSNKRAVGALGDPEKTYQALRKEWNKHQQDRLQALDEQCERFTGLSKGLIKAAARNVDVESVKRSLRAAFASGNIKDQKLDDLCRLVKEAENPLKVWDEVLAELETLVLHVSSGAVALPKTKLLDSASFIGTEKTRLTSVLDYRRWVDLSVTELGFNPKFEYCTNATNGEFIAFADASAGQQATALLTVLLNQSGAPLIIDQPEDDVDSKMSPDIVRQLWEAKTRRQLIFASHNANFVVNGDAELVICCDYVRSGDQTGGHIKATGAIDNALIREEITAVTEGGKEAFKLRMEKYGF